MLSFHTRVGLYHLFFPDTFPLMPVTTLHQHHMKDLAFQQISEFLIIFFSIICRDGINKFCFPRLPQIHSIPKGKVNLNIYKLSRLLIMINITTSRAETLQNVTHVNRKHSQIHSRQGAAPPTMGQLLVSALWEKAGICHALKCQLLEEQQDPQVHGICLVFYANLPSQTALEESLHETPAF